MRLFLAEEEELKMTIYYNFYFLTLSDIRSEKKSVKLFINTDGLKTN